MSCPGVAVPSPGIPEAPCASSVPGGLPGTLRHLAQMPLPPGSPPGFLPSPLQICTPSSGPFPGVLIACCCPAGPLYRPHRTPPPGPTAPELREVGTFAQRHTAGKWQSQHAQTDWSPVLCLRAVQPSGQRGEEGWEAAPAPGVGPWAGDYTCDIVFKVPLDSE